MSRSSVVVTFDSLSAAEQAVQTLHQAGIPSDDLSIAVQSERETVGGKVIRSETVTLPANEMIREGVVGGAWVMGLIGLTLGAAFTWLPNYSQLLPVAPVLVTLLGGLIGTIVGAIGGALLGYLASHNGEDSVVQENQTEYGPQEYAVVARGDAETVAQARSILADIKGTT
jgi:uncharacterized membrane protein